MKGETKKKETADKLEAIFKCKTIEKMIDRIQMNKPSVYKFIKTT